MVPERLKNQRVYLAGAIDRVEDRGSGWRDDITPFLNKMGIMVFNPLKKPSQDGVEDSETHNLKLKLKKNENFDELSKIMKNIRSIDLRLVDISDFLIVNINLQHHACGTYEEISLANRSKKPILIHIEQGKVNTPDWLFGTIPHQWFFSSWEELKSYLEYVHNDKNMIDHHDRWRFFNF